MYLSGETSKRQADGTAEQAVDEGWKAEAAEGHCNREQQQQSWWMPDGASREAREALKRQRPHHQPEEVCLTIAAACKSCNNSHTYLGVLFFDLPGSILGNFCMPLFVILIVVWFQCLIFTVAICNNPDVYMCLTGAPNTHHALATFLCHLFRTWAKLLANIQSDLGQFRTLNPPPIRQ